MNWLTDYVKPKLGAFTGRGTPDNLWHKCPQCGQLIFNKDYAAAQKVCSNCGHHGRLGPKERFAALFDNGHYNSHDLPAVKEDPLKFRDTKRYSDRLKEARQKTGEFDAVELATGQVGGIDVVVLVQNFFFMGGSMGLAVGEAFITAAQKAIDLGSPLIVFVAAGGARMQEGILSLMQMPRTTVMVERLREEGLPFISVMTDPTTGGVTASYAMLGDVNMAEPGALIGFAGPRVIEQTIREKLPEGFQRAEYLLEHGMLDKVVPRAELRATLIRIVALLSRDGASAKGEATQISFDMQAAAE